jgi:hypothetical protein
MHKRQAALTNAILALILLVATPTRAEEDAATKAREGDVNHWIEYYRKNHQQPQPVAPGRQDAVAEEERERRKGKR